MLSRGRPSSLPALPSVSSVTSLQDGLSSHKATPNPRVQTGAGGVCPRVRGARGAQGPRYRPAGRRTFGGLYGLLATGVTHGSNSGPCSLDQDCPPAAPTATSPRQGLPVLLTLPLRLGLGPG